MLKQPDKHEGACTKGVHQLILFVTLNVNKNAEPVRALSKMLLQSMQLMVGKC